MPKYNLASPSSIREKCNLNDLDSWLKKEASLLENSKIHDLIISVATNLDHWISWPSKSLLLWQGCSRTHGGYHKYPDEIKALAKINGVILDTRANGPAIAAFLISGGKRPQRFGSQNAWSIHHLYSGKFPYLGNKTTLHATKDGNHFTQSAGLVAAHPVADAMCDEFPFFAWYLRAKAFQKFAYDPDGVFK